VKEISYLSRLAPGKEDRLRVGAMIDRAHVRRFVVQYEAYIDGRWQPIIRYDTAQGFAHRDIYHARNPPMKEVLAVQDFNEAFTFAIRDIRLLWRYYRDGYEKE
jgi:hypothetical protein